MEGSTFAHVTFTAPEGNPLSGLIDWPTNRQYTTLAAQAPIWELAAVEAAKHALAAGGALHGISLTQNVAGRPAPPGPDVSVALTGREIPAQPPATMSIDQVQSNVKNALPPWASNPTVTVLNDAVGERVVTVTLGLPRTAFALLDVPDALAALVEQQHVLSDQGARIGRAVVKVVDAVGGDPLYVAGVDGFMGYGTSWVSPMVQGLMSEQVTPESVPSQASDLATDPAGYAQGIATSPVP